MTIATQTGIEEADKGFDIAKLSVDPHCYECKVKYRDPRPKDLVMFLHAWTYSVRHTFVITLSNVSSVSKVSKSVISAMSVLSVLSVLSVVSAMSVLSSLTYWVRLAFVITAQCGNSLILLSLRFYVKLILGILKVQNLPLNFEF